MAAGGWSRAPHPPGAAFRSIPLQPPPFQRSSRRRLRGLSRRHPAPSAAGPAPSPPLWLCAGGGAEPANGEQRPAAPSADRRGERPMRAPGGRGQLSIIGPYLGLASGRARGMAILSLHHPLSIPLSIRSSLSRPARPSPPLRLLPAPAWPHAAAQAPRVWRLPWGSQRAPEPRVPPGNSRLFPQCPTRPFPARPRLRDSGAQPLAVPRAIWRHHPVARGVGAVTHPPPWPLFCPQKASAALLPSFPTATSTPTPAALSLPLRPNSC